MRKGHWPGVAVGAAAASSQRGRGRWFIRRPLLLGLLLGGWLVLGGCRPAYAARYIQARVERDGAVLLWTSFTDLETEGAPVLWRRLEGVPFVAKAVLTPDADAAGQITLTGDLRVVIVWGGGTEKLVASAAVDELRLVRVPGTDRWRLPREEVERTAQVAGLDLTEPRLPALIFVAAGVACCVLLGTLVVLIRRGRSHGVVGA